MTVTWERNVTEVTWESATTPGVTWTARTGGIAAAVAAARLVPTPLGDPGQVVAVNDAGTGTEFVDQTGGTATIPDPVHAVSDAPGLTDVDDIVGTITDITAAEIIAAGTLRVICDAPTNAANDQIRALIRVPPPSEWTDCRVWVEPGSKDFWGASLWYEEDTPAVLDLGNIINAYFGGTNDFGGLVLEFDVDGTPVTVGPLGDYTGDPTAFFVALLGPFVGQGATFEQDFADYTGNRTLGYALVTEAVGTGVTIACTDGGVGDPYGLEAQTPTAGKTDQHVGFEGLNGQGSGTHTSFDQQLPGRSLLVASNGSIMVAVVTPKRGEFVNTLPQYSDDEEADDYNENRILAGANAQTNLWELEDAVIALIETPPGGGSGDVVGPASATDGRAVEFDGTTGKLIKAANLTGAGGRPVLDEAGTWADNLIPSTITRDTEVTAAISAALDALLDGAPGALDTLNELAAAVNDDASFAASVTTSLAGKVPTTRTVNGHALSGDVTVTPADVGLLFGLLGSDDNVANSSTALVDAPSSMSFPVVNGGVYRFIYLLLVTATTNNVDLRAALTFPTGTMSAFVTGVATTDTSGFGTAIGRMLGIIDTSGVHVACGVVSGVITRVEISGTFTAGADGTVQLQRCQNASTGAAGLTLKAGSLLDGRRAA